MWLARPVYEFLPYLYMLVGVVMLGAAWFIEMSTLPSILLVVGVLSMMAGVAKPPGRTNAAAIRSCRDARDA